MKLKEIRIDRKLTQKTIADHLGCSTVVYSRYETGAREPSADTLAKLAAFYGVSVDYLLGREEQTKNAPAPDPEAEAREQLVSLLMEFSPEEIQRIMDFAAGIKAARK